jgi:hypothetical protein
MRPHILLSVWGQGDFLTFMRITVTTGQKEIVPMISQSGEVFFRFNVLYSQAISYSHFTKMTVGTSSGL